MDDIPADFRFTKTHEWAQKNDDGSITMGISHHAQQLLGELVFVELPEPGNHCNAGDELAVVESVKAASDVYAPISGEIIEVNEALQDNPSIVNTDAFGDGWICRIRPTDEQDFEELLSSENYQELVEAE